MKRNKRLISMIFLLALGLLLLSGCAENTPKNENDRLRVVTTIFPPYDFARSIAGEEAEITMLLSPGAEVHTYEPTPQDIIKIQDCDVFIHVGGASDSWVNEILASVDTSSMEIVTLMDCVEPLEEHHEGVEHHHEEEGSTPHYDEHVWTSPRNTMRICDKITEALCRTDEEKALVFTERNAALQKELTALDEDFTALIDAAPRKTLVFADRFPIRYFTEAYGLKYYAAYPGCAAEAEPSAATVAFLIDKVREEEIPAVFSIEFSNERMADTIVEETGCKKLNFHTCHNVTREEFDAGENYLSLMRKNLDALKEALY